MICCDPIRPLLFRIAEKEASPEEAIAVARHLSDCTACRILLARERRLAEMLERDLDDPLTVGDEFLDAVMANLPQDPPVRSGSRKLRRLRGTIKLAGGVGLGFLLPRAALNGLPWDPAVFRLPTLPGLGLDGSPDAWAGLAALARLAVVALGATGDPLPRPATVALGGALVLIVLALAAGTALLGGTALVALGAGGVSSRRRRTG